MRPAIILPCGAHFLQVYYIKGGKVRKILQIYYNFVRFILQVPAKIYLSGGNASPRAIRIKGEIKWILQT